MPPGYETDDSVSLPKHGGTTRIAVVYHDKQGYLLLKYVFKQNGSLHVAFFDVQKKKTILLNQGEEPPDPKGRASSESMWHAITPEFQVQLPNGTKVGHYPMAPINTYCGWPYAPSILLEPRTGSSKKMTVLTRLDAPNAHSFSSACDGTDWATVLKPKYLVAEVPFFLRDTTGGYYLLLQDSAYLIHFRGDGTSSFFDGRRDIVLMGMLEQPPYGYWDPDRRAALAHFLKSSEQTIDDAISAQVHSRKTISHTNAL